jgi:hypothetical protein
VKNIGKPCAGKSHARLDEGGQATPVFYSTNFHSLSRSKKGDPVADHQVELANDASGWSNATYRHEIGDVSPLRIACRGLASSRRVNGADAAPSLNAVSAGSSVRARWTKCDWRRNNRNLQRRV